MKRVLLTLGFAVGLCGTAAAQEDLMQLVRSDLRAQAQSLMTEAMHLSNDDATKFWPIYREYEFERSKWTDGRIALIKTYGENFESMSDTLATRLAQNWFKLQDSRLKLYKTYHQRVAKAVSPIVAARFLQVEYQINLVIDLQIAEQMPLVFKIDEGNH